MSQNDDGEVYKPTVVWCGNVGSIIVASQGYVCH